MIKSLLRNFTIAIAFLVVSSSANATHIMGGSMYYQYLGVDSTTGYYNYQVTLELFRLCDPGSSNLPLDMNLGVYEDDSLNPTGDKILVVTTLLPLIIQQPIVPPPGNASCAFTPNVCVEEGIYQAIISVPPNSTGYYFISDRCCRNNTIANLNNPGNDGEAYFAQAPPPTVVNNSPTFAAVPVPFICSNDTVSVLNQAYDADGDLLVYNFVTPYNGVSDNANPNPNPPVTYPWPIPTVTYAPTYSVTDPFGPGGYANMNAGTGLASYYVPNQGFYVVAVEIQEFRNGILIGVSRRDIQIIVIPCPVNPSPVLSATTTQTTYTIDEGDTLCFNNTFVDANGDSIFITHTGNIFNGATTNPPATYIDSSGLGTATGQFCWITSCNQGGPVPYQFTVIATDNGCPAKTTNIVYTINVQNTPKPTPLTGPDTLCFNPATGVIFSVPSSPGFSYAWNVTNGTIIGPSNGDSITVNFTGTGNSIVSAALVNHNGCVSDTVAKQVVVNSIPTASAGPDKSFCGGGTATLGTPPVPGYTYSWFPTTGLGNPAAGQTSVTLVNNGTIGLFITYILTVTSNGCTSTDTVVVNVKPTPVLSAGPDVSICTGNTVVIGLLPVPGQSYSWTPASGLSSTTVANPTVTLTNGGTSPITQTYAVMVTNTYSCSSVDSVNVIVNAIPVAVAGPDVAFCSGSSATLGTGATVGYSYSWSPISGLNNPTLSNPVVSLINLTSQNDTIYYVLTTSQSPCVSHDTVMVIVKPNSTANAGPDQFFCSGGSTTIGTTSTSGYTYSWSPITGLSSSTISNPVVTVPNPNPTPDTLTYIVTTTLNGCVSSDTVQIIVGPAPVASAGADVTYCSGDSVFIGSANTVNYNYNWSPSTGLSNSTVSNPVVIATNTTGINDTIYYVVTVTSFGCSATDTVMVVVQPASVANAGPDQFFCSGGSTTIGTTSTSGYTYSWSPITGLSSSTISNPVVTVPNPNPTPDTLTYIVTTTLNGCVSSDTVQIIVGPAPVAAAGADVTYCSGDSVFIGSANTVNYNYNWSPSTGLSNSTVSNPVVIATNTTGVNDTIYYVVTVTSFGCSATDTVMVIVQPAPVSNAGPDVFFCSGGSATLGTTTTSGYSYSWSPSTSLSSDTISDPVFTWTNTGTDPDTLVYVVTTTLGSCVTTDSVQIIISPVPTAIAGPDVVFCSGSSAVLGTGASLNYGYTWSPSTGLSSATVSNPTLTLVNVSGVNDTLSYIVTTTLFGCTDSDTMQVIVKPNPLSAAGNDATLCGGDTIQLGTTSTSGYTYNWTPIAGLSSDTISNPVLIVSNSGGSPTSTTYVVTTTLNGCSTTDSVTILVNPQPTVTAVANPGSICLGDSTTLTASGASTYSWAISTAPGTVISTSSTLVVNPATTTTYILTGTTSSSCSNTGTVTVNVSPLPLVQITNTSNNLCVGDSVTLTATGASTYTWSVLGGATIGTGSNVQVSPTVNTTYVVVGVNSGSCSNSDTISIIVNPAATLAAINGTLSVCPGVLGVQYWIVNPDPNSTYTWSVTNGTIISGQNTDTITIDWSILPGIGTVSVFETTNLGCESPLVTLTITINTLLTPPSPTGPTSFCANDALGVQYSALNTSGSTYNWYAQGGVIVGGNGTSSVTVDWTATGPITVALWYEENSVTAVDTCFGTSDTLYVTLNPAPIAGPVTGPVGICISDTGTFSVPLTGGSSYSWSVTGGTILTGSGTNAITVNWAGSGSTTITLIETNSFGCSDTVSLPVTINSLPSISAGSDVGVCVGQSVMITATGGLSYVWTPGATLNNPASQSPLASPTVSTVYTVVGTDANGCKNTDSVLVTVYSLPVVTISSNTAICTGNSTQLTAGGGNSYQWSPAGTLNNDTINNPTANPTSTTTYTVVVTDSNTCSNSGSVIVTVNSLPSITAGNDVTICQGASTTLSAGGGVSYSWSPATYLDNSNSANPVASPANSTSYVVTGTDANGCVNTATVSVSINVNPEANFTVQDGDVSEVTCEGYAGKLTNISKNATSYQWIFPNGSTSSEENPEVQFNLSGNNTITLIAVNNMCYDTLNADFASTVVSQIFTTLPNVVTPNGDGKNDCFDFGPTVNLDQCSKWEVFNRWGKKVFTSSPSHPCWNGEKDGDGKDLSVGTYYYIITVAGEAHHGTITLIR